MRVVIAPDSFKGSLSSKQVSLAMERGIKRFDPHIETILLPMADGGEGTTESLVFATNGKKKQVEVIGPDRKRVKAQYGVLGDHETCVIETASASGLHLIEKSKLNPLKATSYGTGQLIKTALDDGYRKFIIGLGGSATNDGGAGLLQALGLHLLDKDGQDIGFGGEELSKITKIDDIELDQRLKDSRFLIACDVKNPFVGHNGATYTFGEQKGATPEMLVQLEQNLTYFANLIYEYTGCSIDNQEGAGAAGGIGGALMAFLPVTVKSGISILMEYTNFKQHIKTADIVLTGEGRIDHQTVFGKAPLGIAIGAKKQSVPVVVLAGSIGEEIDVLYDYGITSIHSIVNEPMLLESAIDRAEILIERCAEQVIRLYSSGLQPHHSR